MYVTCAGFYTQCYAQLLVPKTAGKIEDFAGRFLRAYAHTFFD